jgi:hypothetical protein
MEAPMTEVGKTLVECLEKIKLLQTERQEADAEINMLRLEVERLEKSLKEIKEYALINGRNFSKLASSPPINEVAWHVANMARKAIEGE